MGERHWLRVSVLLLIALACAIVSNSLAGPERRLAWLGAPPAAVSRVGAPEASPLPKTTPVGERVFAPHPDKPYLEISGEETDELFRKGALFFDARRTAVYREGHIAGARPFSVWESDIDDKVKAFFGEGHDSSAPMVAYCSGGECEDSHMLAQKLYMAGFDDVVVYKDGFPDWQKRGLPIHQGDVP